MLNAEGKAKVRIHKHGNVPSINFICVTLFARTPRASMADAIRNAAWRIRGPSRTPCHLKQCRVCLTCKVWEQHLLRWGVIAAMAPGYFDVVLGDVPRNQHSAKVHDVLSRAAPSAGKTDSELATCVF